MVYYLKGSSARLVYKVAFPILDNDEIISQINRDDLNRNLINFIHQSYSTAFKSVIFDLFILILIITLIAILLGAVGIIGFLAGINLIGSCVILLSLTTVNAWRNANDFREHNKRNDK